MQTTITRDGASKSQSARRRFAYLDDTTIFVRRFAPRGRDPAVADENLYRYCENEPTEATDPSGLVLDPTGDANTNVIGPQSSDESERHQSWKNANTIRSSLANEIDDSLTGTAPFNGDDSQLLKHLEIQTNRNSFWDFIVGCSEFNNPAMEVKGGGGFKTWNNYAEVVSGVCSSGTFCCNTITMGSMKGSASLDSGAVRIYVEDLPAGKYDISVLYEAKLRTVPGGAASFRISPAGQEEIRGNAINLPAGTRRETFDHYGNSVRPIG